MLSRRLRWRLAATRRLASALGLPKVAGSMVAGTMVAWSCWGLQACSPSGPTNTAVPVTTVTVASADAPTLRPVATAALPELASTRPLATCPKDSYRQWTCGSHSEQQPGTDMSRCYKRSDGLWRRASYPVRIQRAIMPFDAPLTRHYRATAEKMGGRRAKKRAEHCCYSTCTKAKVAKVVLPTKHSTTSREFVRCLPAFDSVSVPASEQPNCAAVFRETRFNSWMKYDAFASKQHKDQAKTRGGVAGVEVCCYRGKRRYRIMKGRPIRVAGKPRLSRWQSGGQWLWPTPLCEAAAAQLTAGNDADQALAAALAKSWQHDAALEHASVAAFARLANELLVWGACPDLIVGCHRAAQDEVRHAQLAARLATTWGAEPMRPGPLALPSEPQQRSLEAILWETFEDGCIGELVAAASAQQSAELCGHRELADIYATIADDELDHAELAWRILAWGVPRSRRLRERLSHWLAGSQSMSKPPLPRRDAVAPQALRARDWGLLHASDEELLRQQIVNEVVRPTLQGLLDRSAAMASDAQHTAARTPRHAETQSV